MKLNKDIWRDKEEFKEHLEYFISMPRKKKRFCSIAMSKSKWNSLYTYFKGNKNILIAEWLIKWTELKKPRKPRKPKRSKARKVRIKYKDYISSKEWKNKRNSRIKNYIDKCECCKKMFFNSQLSLHHHTYKRLGKEKYEDLVVVCKICHYNIHFEEWIKLPLKEKILRKRFENIKKEENF